jgi:hypothetical protein
VNAAFFFGPGGCLDAAEVAGAAGLVESAGGLSLCGERKGDDRGKFCRLGARCVADCAAVQRGDLFENYLSVDA